MATWTFSFLKKESESERHICAYTVDVLESGSLFSEVSRDDVAILAFVISGGGTKGTFCVVVASETVVYDEAVVLKKRRLDSTQCRK